MRIEALLENAFVGLFGFSLPMTALFLYVMRFFDGPVAPRAEFMSEQWLEEHRRRMLSGGQEPTPDEIAHRVAPFAAHSFRLVLGGYAGSDGVFGGIVLREGAL